MKPDDEHQHNPLRSEVAQAMSLDLVRYSEVWEDHQILSEALAVDGGDHVLSIASGGCNVFALLLDEPERITAIDMNPAQIALLELKIAGIEELEYEDFLVLVGHQAGDAVEVYGQIRGGLTPSTRRFWDDRPGDLEDGVYRCGRLDRFFRGFQDDHLPRYWDESLLKELLSAESLDDQAEIFEERGFTEAFQDAFTSYFSRERLAAEGRDPAQFKYVTGTVGETFLSRFRRVCTALPLKGNFYVERFLAGQVRDLRGGPLYVRREHFERLRGLTDRVELVCEELEVHLERAPSGTYSKANLSDVFEYMSVDASDQLFGVLGDRMRTGGRLAYWNLLVERRPPTGAGWTYERELSEELFQRDRAWFYGGFFVEERR